MFATQSEIWLIVDGGVCSSIYATTVVVHAKSAYFRLVGSAASKRPSEWNV